MGELANVVRKAARRDVLAGGVEHFDLHVPANPQALHELGERDLRATDGRAAARERANQKDARTGVHAATP